MMMKKQEGKTHEKTGRGRGEEQWMPCFIASKITMKGAN